MQSAETNSTPPASPTATLGDIIEECYQRTAAALYEARAATQMELSQCITVAREANKTGLPADLIEVLARLKGIEEDQLATGILDLSEFAAASITPHAPVVPFAGRLIAPSAFYDTFPTLKKAASSLLTPIIYAEDTDSIGIASINPVACQMMGELVVQTVHERTRIRPFITIARLDYATWSLLTRKHFGL